MDLKLAGRTALITGGSRGIGLGVAQSLAAEGCHVHLTSRNAADLDAARGKIIGAHKVNVTCHALDLGVSADTLLGISPIPAVDPVTTHTFSRRPKSMGALPYPR